MLDDMAWISFSCNRNVPFVNAIRSDRKKVSLRQGNEHAPVPAAVYRPVDVVQVQTQDERRKKDDRRVRSASPSFRSSSRQERVRKILFFERRSLIDRFRSPLLAPLLDPVRERLLQERNMARPHRSLPMGFLPKHPSKIPHARNKNEDLPSFPSKRACISSFCFRRGSSRRRKKRHVLPCFRFVSRCGLGPRWDGSDLWGSEPPQ